MKRFITLISLCFPLIALAQIEKGKSVLTGSISYFSSTTKNTAVNATGKNTSFNVAASYAYLLSDNWAIGLSSYLQKNHGTGDNDSYSYTTSFAISPFVRRYFPIGEKFFVFVDGGVRATLDKGRSSSGAGFKSKDKTTGFDIYITPGVNYMLSNKLALQATIGGLSYNNDKRDEWKTASFSSSLGISSFALGASWIF